MPQNKNIPAKGANLYHPHPGDKRPIITARVGGVELRMRFPGAPNRAEFPPIRESVIYMKDRTLTSRPMMPDPYL